MIQSFNDKDTKQFYEARGGRKWTSVKAVALRKLDQIEASRTLEDLSVPPGNQLELLKGDRKGQHSIRINDQYRICFIWKEDGAHNVEITDYH